MALSRDGEDVASMVRGASGELLIGATNTLLAQLLPEAMEAMKKDYPNLTLSVRTEALASAVCRPAQRPSRHGGGARRAA